MPSLAPRKKSTRYHKRLTQSHYENIQAYTGLPAEVFMKQVIGGHVTWVGLSRSHRVRLIGVAKQKKRIFEMAKRAAAPEVFISPEARPVFEEVFRTYQEAWKAGKMEVISDEQVDQRIEDIIGPLQAQLRTVVSKPRL